ncbi:uroporphyrinogen-III C-methyltransferase [Candidatus Hydrogenedentota bacterium]
MKPNKTNEKRGKVYLVGAGPGDPGLITVKGMECIKKADVVVIDYLANPMLQAMIRPDCELIYVGKKASSHTMEQRDINALLVKKGLAGNVVARLKGGDPFVFGRGGEEAMALVEAGVEFEVVPGVTSGVAAPAYAGIPVTTRRLSSSVTLVTGHEDPTKPESDVDWQFLASSPGTVCFYMGVKNLPKIAARLIEAGKSPDTPVALVRWGTHPEQEALTGTLNDIAEKAKEAGFNPPAITVVGEVVKLREHLTWFENKPLFGQTIVVTRARKQAGDLSAKLAELGAAVIECPTIEIGPPIEPEKLSDAAKNAGQYDWLVFTSVNGVDAFFDALRANGLDARALGKTRVCAIGPATLERLECRGIVADCMPEKYVAESVAEALLAIGSVEGKSFLLPRADIARSALPEMLAEYGATVDDIEAYSTITGDGGKGPVLKLLDEGKLDAVTFTSSSTARNFVKLFSEEIDRFKADVTFASIGPVTTKTATELGLDIDIEAGEYTIPGLISALREKFDVDNE